jgi:nicotinamidase-related amidase
MPSGRPAVKTALLIIDAQVGLLDGAFRAADVLATIGKALRAAREARAPVIYLRHNHASFAPLMRGAPTWEIHPSVSPQIGESVLDKTASDGFWQTELETLLNAEGVSDLAVTGLQTEFCVDATCRAAVSRGFNVTLVSDGHTTGDAVTDAATTIRHHTYALTHLAHPTHSIVAKHVEEIVFG